MDDNVSRMQTPLRILSALERPRRRPASRAAEPSAEREASASAEESAQASFGRAAHTEPGGRIDLTA